MDSRWELAEVWVLLVGVRKTVLWQVSGAQEQVLEEVVQLQVKGGASACE
jgi:hypothetical protein